MKEIATLPRRSPLHRAFAAAGARFTVRAGWELPEEFSGALEEYRAATEHAVVADRSYRGKLRVSGKDRLAFLQNMLTNDIQTLVPGGGLPAALLNRQGKIISDLIVYRLEDSLLLEMEPERCGPVQEALSHHLVSEDVRLEVVGPDEEALLSVEGPRAATILSGALGNSPDSLAPFHFKSGRLEGIGFRVSAVRHSPGPGFDLAVPGADGARLLERLLQEGRQMGLRPAGLRALEIRRIEAGIPLYGVDMDESHLLLEVGLESAVSFNKGCYIGQEYVIRLAHRGHVNRKLVGLTVLTDEVPQPGSEIAGGGRPVGQVTSAAHSPGLGVPIALGYVHRDFIEPGTEVSVRTPAARQPARVTALPFIPAT